MQTIPATTDTQPTEAEQLAAGLLEMADWIQRHPDLPMPYGITHSTYPVGGAHGQIGFQTREELERVADDLGVMLVDRVKAGQYVGTYQTGRISLTLVWFAPKADGAVTA